MNEIKNLNKGPLTYEDWYDLGYTLVPCEGGRPTVKKWSDADFKITKEEWKNKYADKEIGLVTSGGYGPSVSAAVAMGYVDFDCSEVGTSVELEVRGKKYPAKVCLLPFYKKSYAK